MASFQAKIGWKWPRTRENKKNRSDEFLPDPEQRIKKKIAKKFKKFKIVSMSSYPTRNREFQKNSKKIQKNKKTPLWHLFKPKEVANG